MKFKRGYVFAEASEDIQIDTKAMGWSTLSFCNYELHYDPLNKAVKYEDENNSFLILGYAIDLIHNTSNLSDICKHMVSRVSESESSLFEYLDYLSGRYLIIYNYDNQMKILSDATGMMSIVYSKTHKIISSHVKLASTITKAAPNDKIQESWKAKYGGHYIPGHFTPYSDIYFLTPNTYFNITNDKVVRFFPRKELEMLPVDNIVNDISDLVKNQLHILHKDFQHIIFSLTAGIDSRTTLALSKEMAKDIDFFTYYKIDENNNLPVKSLEIDKIVVEDIVYNLGLKHKFLPLKLEDTSTDFRNFAEIIKDNVIKPHNFKLAKFYHNQFSDQDIHIRSNILEIGRYFYRNKYQLPKELSIEALSLCFSPKAHDDTTITDLFKEYCDVVQMTETYNYDPYDLFYWEYRMGIWHSLVLLESDISHNTFIPFNSRHILNLFLSVEESHKKNFTIFKKLIKMNWPVLEHWGINTLEKPIDKLANQQDRYGENLLGFKIASNAPYSVKKTERYITFLLKESAPKKGDYVECSKAFKTVPNKQYLFMLNVLSPYENPKNTGRLKYQVLVDDTPIFEEDIAYWRESNCISIPFKASRVSTRISVKVTAIKDCEQWSWGRAGKITVERLLFREINNESIQFTPIATSPFCKQLTAENTL